MSESERSLLVLFPNKHMGNVLLALPHIKALLDANQSCLVLLTSAYRPLVEESIGTDPRIIFLERKNFSEGHLISRAAYFWHIVRRLRQQKAEVVLDPEAEPISTNIMRLCGVKRRIGPSFTKRAKYYTEVKQLDKDQLHIFDCYQAVCSDYYPSPPPKSYLSFRHNEQAHASLLRKLQNLDFVTNAPTLLAHVAATKDYKQWPAQYFAQLFERAAEKGWQVVTIGAGKMDRDKIAQVTALCTSPIIDTCDRLSLKELIALMQLANAYVGNDSGPMHLSAATGTPTLGLFGPTNSTTWAPIAENAQIIKGRTPCDPACKRSYCVQEYACLRSLAVEQVLHHLTPFFENPNYT